MDDIKLGIYELFKYKILNYIYNTKNIRTLLKVFKIINSINQSIKNHENVFIIAHCHWSHDRL